MIALKDGVLEKLCEEAGKLSHELLGARDLLKQKRQALSELCAKFTDVVAEPKDEEAKRDTIATYRATLAQVELAIAALESSPVEPKELQAQIEESLLRGAELVFKDRPLVAGLDGFVTHGQVRWLMKERANNLAAGFADCMVRR